MLENLSLGLTFVTLGLNAVKAVIDKKVKDEKLEEYVNKAVEAYMTKKEGA